MLENRHTCKLNATWLLSHTFMSQIRFTALWYATVIHASWLPSHTFMSQIRFTALWYATAMLRIDPQDTLKFQFSIA